MSMADVCAKD
jgi:hypothetical protein